MQPGTGTRAYLQDGADLQGSSQAEARQREIDQRQVQDQSLFEWALLQRSNLDLLLGFPPSNLCLPFLDQSDEPCGQNR